MRIAVIGGGVSGLGAAWALRDVHDVTVFEGATRLGGHANTVDVDYDGRRICVDTGFIVYNELNYPNLVGLFEALGVETVASDMSFAVSDPAGYEWSSNGLSGLFAWKRNLTNPAFLCMLGDIVRFSRSARDDLKASGVADQESLEDYVARLKLGQSFLKHYLLPMGAAIWSTPERDMLRYPAASFLRFFDNHRLLHATRPKWRTVKGGSREYVRKLAADLDARVRVGDPVVDARTIGDEVLVRTRSGAEARFDQVIFACHSDEALAALPDADPRLKEALAAVRYAPNTAYLHRDPSLMPRRRSAWASWNYLRRGGSGDQVCVSYWMNLLQALDPQRPLFVTLNPPEAPRAELTFAKLTYAHPQFDGAAMQAQRVIQGLQGQGRLWFAGAWMGYGFHEDGLSSGLAVAKRLGGRVPWAQAQPRNEAASPPHTWAVPEPSPA